MKTNFKALLLIVSILTLSLTSCTKEESEDTDSEDFTVNITGVYEGEMSDYDTYEPYGYTVIVNKINSSKIEIIPSGSGQSTFEVTIKKGGDNSIISENPTSESSVAFTKTDGVYTLTYWFTDSNDHREDYTGEKQ